MSFAQPLFLWALAGISIPLAIHLLSRREGKVVKVGSLRHIDESNTSRFKSLRLNEIWLLAARCLLITWLVLLLAGAQCTTPGSNASSKWLLIEQGMHDNKSIISLIDSLTDDGFELRALADGFPLYDEEDSVVVPDYWTITEALRKKQDHEIIVLAYSYVNGFTQARVSRPENLTWINVDPGEREFISFAKRFAPDSAMLTTGRSDAHRTTYITSQVAVHPSREYLTVPLLNDSTRILAIDTLKVCIVDDKSHATDARVLKASLAAIGDASGVHILNVSQQEAEWTFWLPDAGPETKVTGKLVRLSPQASMDLVQQVSRVEWHITQRLTPDVALDSHFATELSKLLLKDKTLAVQKNDMRSMPEKIVWAGTKGVADVSIEPVSARDLSTILILLLVLTWAAERSIALSKNL